MQSIGFSEALDAVLRDDPRYDREAYTFLREVLDASVKRRRKARKEVTRPPSEQHVSVAELLDGFRLHAIKEFGPMAKLVLDAWGVRNCEDIGNMVFHLAKAQVFGMTDEDRIEDFRAGFDFEEAFVAPFRPDQQRLSRSPGMPVSNE